jgi:hypothetical protein
MLTLMQIKYVETKPTQWPKVQKDKSTKVQKDKSTKGQKVSNKQKQQKTTWTGVSKPVY